MTKEEATKNFGPCKKGDNNNIVVGDCQGCKWLQHGWWVCMKNGECEGQE